MGEVWKVAISDSLNKFLGEVVMFLPNLLTMITILIIGLLIAWIFKKLLFRFLKAIQFDRVSERSGLTHALSIGHPHLWRRDCLFTGEKKVYRAR